MAGEEEAALQARLDQRLEDYKTEVKPSAEYQVVQQLTEDRRNRARNCGSCAVVFPVGTSRCCPPHRPTHFEPSLKWHGIL